MVLEDKDKVIRKSRGNHRANSINPFDWAGGRLILTSARLVFRPHSLNFRTDEESIPLENINSIRADHSDFISSKISLFLENGCFHEFRVPKRKDWIQDIEKAVKLKKEARGQIWNNQMKLDRRIPRKPLWPKIKIVIQTILLASLVSLLIYILLR